MGGKGKGGWYHGSGKGKGGKGGKGKGGKGKGKEPSGPRVMSWTRAGAEGAPDPPPIVAHKQVVLESLALHGTVFDKTVPDPSESLVLECATFAREEGVDSVVGFGGGSSMDVAKLVSLLASPTSSQPLGEMFGVGNARGERLPLLQVPTTAGTGSEVTPISIITTGVAEKKGVVSPLLLPDLAVLDGDLTLSLPAAVSAASGLDAMVHAIEAYTSRTHKNPLSDVYAREALRLLSANIVQVCDEFQRPSGARRHEAYSYP